MCSSFFNGIRALGRNERGIASVEFVLVLPVMMVMLGVAIDVGRMLMDYHGVSKSVRDATRYLTRIEGFIDCGAATPIDTSSATVQGAIDKAIRLAMTGAIDGNTATEPLVKSWRTATVSQAASGVTISSDCVPNNAPGGVYPDMEFSGLYDGAATMPAIEVSAAVPFHFSLAGFLGVGPTINLRVSEKMAYIGQ